MTPNANALPPGDLQIPFPAAAGLKRGRPASRPRQIFRVTLEQIEATFTDPNLRSLTTDQLAEIELHLAMMTDIETRLGTADERYDDREAYYTRGRKVDQMVRDADAYPLDSE